MVDIDDKLLIIQSPQQWSRRFPLHNLPHQLPEHKNLEELFLGPISLQHLHLKTLKIEPSNDNIARFASFGPSEERLEFSEPARIVDPWKLLGSFVLDGFVQRYLTPIWSITVGYISPHIMSYGADGNDNPARDYRQIAYAILVMCQPAGSVVFGPKRLVIRPQ